MEQTRSVNVLESLESRTHLSGSPLAISPMPGGQAGQWLIVGTPAKDVIRITQEENGEIRVSNGDSWSATLPASTTGLTIHGREGNDRITIDPAITFGTTLYGNGGHDRLEGGSGNDRIYGGPGRDWLVGHMGDDTLVDVGGGLRDVAVGGAGNDSYWLDVSPFERTIGITLAEKNAGAAHRIQSFYGESRRASSRIFSSTSTLSQSLPDPAVDDEQLQYRSFAANPLFASTGPSADDVYQGNLGDCYLLAALSAVARSQPQFIQQSIADLGDGTYAVQFFRGGKRYFVRVDADLPISPTGALAYADTGREGSLWVALYEKAYAIFRSGAASYDSLTGGWMEEVNEALGKRNTIREDFSAGNLLLEWIQRELNRGRAVTFGTRDPNGAPVLWRHGYSVDGVETNEQGQPVALRLRNPWGMDGVANDSPNDGYVTITARQAIASYWMVVSAA